MTDQELTPDAPQPEDRDRQARRTTAVRRGVVAVGALGTAVAIGATTTTSSAAGTGDDTPTPGTTRPAYDDGTRAQPNSTRVGDGQRSHRRAQARQAPSPSRQQGSQQGSSSGSGQLASPGGGSPPQGHSGGS